MTLYQKKCENFNFPNLYFYGHFWNAFCQLWLVVTAESFCDKSAIRNTFNAYYNKTTERERGRENAYNTESQSAIKNKTENESSRASVIIKRVSINCLIKYPDDHTQYDV